MSAGSGGLPIGLLMRTRIADCSTRLLPTIDMTWIGASSAAASDASASTQKSRNLQTVMYDSRNFGVVSDGSRGVQHGPRTWAGRRVLKAALQGRAPAR